MTSVTLTNIKSVDDKTARMMLRAYIGILYPQKPGPEQAPARRLETFCPICR